MWEARKLNSISMAISNQMMLWRSLLFFVVTYLVNQEIFIQLIVLMQVSKARDVGVNSIVLFPKVPDALKVLIFLD